jgi:hypothetical protein
MAILFFSEFSCLIFRLDQVFKSGNSIEFFESDRKKTIYFVDLQYTKGNQKVLKATSKLRKCEGTARFNGKSSVMANFLNNLTSQLSNPFSTAVGLKIGKHS